MFRVFSSEGKNIRLNIFWVFGWISGNGSVHSSIKSSTVTNDPTLIIQTQEIKQKTKPFIETKKSTFVLEDQ